jgi:hypothetical protein
MLLFLDKNSKVPCFIFYKIVFYFKKMENITLFVVDLSFGGNGP